jgi:hypothetical protein
MIFDHDGAEVARHQLETEQILPRTGWVEHNPVEIWDRTGAYVGAQNTEASAERHCCAVNYELTGDDSVESAHRPAVLQQDRLPRLSRHNTR